MKIACEEDQTDAEEALTGDLEAEVEARYLEPAPPQVLECVPYSEYSLEQEAYVAVQLLQGQS